MTKNNRATWDQHLAVAQVLNKKGLLASQTVAWFKSKGYKLNSLYYDATRVSAMIAGIEATKPPVVESLVDAVALVNDNITSGALKYTKAKMVHKPKEQS